MITLLWLAGVVFPVAVALADVVSARRELFVGTPRALARVAAMIGFSLVFGLLLFTASRLGWVEFRGSGGFVGSARVALRFFAAWLLQVCISFDFGLLVAFILAHAGTDAERHNRVLLWGMLLSILFRCGSIAFCSGVLARASWAFYPFGVLLLFAAARLLVARHDTVRPRRSLLLRLVLSRFPLARLPDVPGAFLVHEGGRRRATPDLVALVLILSVGLLLGLASVPASTVFTSEQLLVFSAGAFGLLAPRSLFYVTVSYLPRLRYLKLTQGLVLAYLGSVTLLEPLLDLPSEATLVIVAGFLVVGGIACVTSSDPDTRRLISPIADDIEELGEVSLKQMQRALVFLVGLALIAVGIAMVPLPVPGTPVMLFGLAILATEFRWARRLKARVSTTLGRLWRGIRGGSS